MKIQSLYWLIKSRIYASRNGCHMGVQETTFSFTTENTNRSEMCHPKKKVALITGINGQDGSYLAELLLNRGYVVHGIIREASSTSEQLYFNNLSSKKKHLEANCSCDPDFREMANEEIPTLHYADLQDFSSLVRVISSVRPDEIYNLGAQSQQDTSFDVRQYTMDVTGVGLTRVAEAVRLAGLTQVTRIFQPSTSTFLDVKEAIENGKALDEHSPHLPKSPYSLAKLFAYCQSRVYRDGFGMFVANAIFFNHESPRRKESFVTRKVSSAVAKIKYGLQEDLELSNLESVVDWGSALDYMEAAWKIVNHDTPDDYVIATGQAKSIRDLCSTAFACIGHELVWRGDGRNNEYGVATDTGKVLVKKSGKPIPSHIIIKLVGNSAKAYRELGWKPKLTFAELISDMVNNDMFLLKKQIYGTSQANNK